MKILLESEKMGCTDSHAAVPIRYQQQQLAPPQNYNNNQSTMFYQMQNAKRPKFLNQQQLDQGRKDILWAIIQRNSLRQFAYYLESERIPSNMEVGPSNTFWNFAHFCARWDAFQCLHYIIKRVYAEQSILLLSLMNQQTIQGYTAIHVAIQWNALSCFYLLLDCGGVDLSYCDKANNDVFAKCHLFKRQQMLRVLQKFKAGNALMVMTQSQNVRGFKDFSQIVAQGQAPTKSQYRLTNERIDQIIDSRNKLIRPPPPPPVQPKQNKNQYQDFYNAIKKIETTKTTNRATSDEGQSIGEGQSEAINRQKIQQQRRFQENQARIKREKAEKLRKDIQRQRQLVEQRLKFQQQQQVNKQRIFEQAELAKIQQQKQIMRKNIQMMHSNSYDNQIKIGKGAKMICPQDIRPLYQAALAKGTKFVDNQFPAQHSSIGNEADFKFGWKDCVWLRPQQMFSGGKYEVFDGISPDDVKQGTLGVCYYLALLSSIAQNQQRIKKIFRFYDKELGFYAIQLYLQGKPKTMIVDDLIPCMKGTSQPLFAKPSSPEVWVMILQKAWVKLFGNYLSAENMAASDMFQNVLPSPSRYYIMDVSKIDETFDKIIQFDRKNYIMVASSSAGDVQTPPGIVKDHAYSLMGAYNINGVKLAKIRNPWAKTQYAGMYSEMSPLWTQQLKQAVGFKNAQDGVFFLTPMQMHTIMPTFTVSMFKDNYQYSYVQITSKSNEEVYFIINIKNEAELAIKLTQQNERFKKKMQYENAPIFFEIYKLEDNYKGKLVYEGEPSTCYGGIFNLYPTLDIFQTYQTGRYLIRLKILYDRAHPTSTRGTYRQILKTTDGKNVLRVRQATSVLSIYGPQTYIFNRLSQQQGEKYMKNLYKHCLDTNEKTSERLRSVGQDLKPTVLSKSLKMKNQIIYVAQNLLPNNSINFKFEFKVSAFRNCFYHYNINKQKNCCEWVLEPNGGWNLATMEVEHPVQQVATQGHLQSDFKIIR